MSFKQRCHDNSDAGEEVILDKVTALVHNVAEAAFKRSQHSQINKLSSFQGNKHSENKKDKDGIDLAGMQMKRWVKVLSKYKPTQAELGVLAKGLNLSITPDHVPIKEIVMVAEVVFSATKT